MKNRKVREEYDAEALIIGMEYLEGPHLFRRESSRDNHGYRGLEFYDADTYEELRGFDLVARLAEARDKSEEVWAQHPKRVKPRSITTGPFPNEAARARSEAAREKPAADTDGTDPTL